MINKNFVKRKILLIEDDLEKISVFKGESFEDISADFIKQAAMERFLERIINRAIDINQYLISELLPKDDLTPKSYKDTFMALAEIDVYSKDFGEKISRSVGTRNVLVHDYDNTKHEMIYSSIEECLRDYSFYCQQLLDFLEKK